MSSGLSLLLTTLRRLWGGIIITPLADEAQKDARTSYSHTAHGGTYGEATISAQLTPQDFWSSGTL